MMVGVRTTVYAADELGRCLGSESAFISAMHDSRPPRPESGLAVRLRSEAFLCGLRAFARDSVAGVPRREIAAKHRQVSSV